MEIIIQLLINSKSILEFTKINLLKLRQKLMKTGIDENWFSLESFKIEWVGTTLITFNNFTYEINNDI